MATFFGEVIESRSRAFWDGDDNFEDEDAFSNLSPEPELLLKFHNESEISYANKLFILVHGPLTSGFAETCLLNDAVIVAEVNVQCADATVIPARRDYEDDLTSRKKTPKSTKLYALNDSVIICLCSPDLKVTQAHRFVECISAWLVESKNVIALTCEFRTSHICDEDDLPAAFLRELSSDYYKGSKYSKSLEQPNLVGGIPAALLSYCQIFKIPAVMYVAYTDSYIADSITARPLVELFSKLPIHLLRKDKLTFEKRLYYGAETESNLYM